MKLEEIQPTTKQLISEYLNISLEEVEKRIKENPENAVKDWNELGKDKYYEKTLVHLFGLAEYNSKTRLEEIVFPFRNRKRLKILDFGGGIGSVSLALADDHDVYYYDVPSETQNFAKFMAKRLEKKITFLTTEDLKNNKFEAIITVDVLEHLEEPMRYVNFLFGLLPNGAYFLTTGLDFSIGPQTPMHLPENIVYRKDFEDFLEMNSVLNFFYWSKLGIIRGVIKR